jgi:acyl-CoA hydrolase
MGRNLFSAAHGGRGMMFGMMEMASVVAFTFSTKCRAVFVLINRMEFMREMTMPFGLERET